MNLVDDFFEELDRLWTPEEGGRRIPLHVIGTTALVLQTNYERGTKDGDVLEVPRQMVERGFVKHPRLVERLNQMIQRFWFDARADLLPGMVARFHRVEADWFAKDPSPFALPELR